MCQKPDLSSGRLSVEDSRTNLMKKVASTRDQEIVSGNCAASFLSRVSLNMSECTRNSQCQFDLTL